MATIETHGLTNYYGDTRGIEDLSLSVESGEVFGYLGLNGAGRYSSGNRRETRTRVDGSEWFRQKDIA
jgi:ABC-type lipopolysaccharide export system ATPase subunit